MNTLHNSMAGNVVAHKFIESLIRADKVEKWQKPYRTVSQFVNFITHKPLRGYLNSFLYAILGNGERYFAGAGQVEDTLKVKLIEGATPITVLAPILKTGKRTKDDGSEETYSYCVGFRYVQTYRLADFPISREEVEKALGFGEDEQADVYKIAESKVAKAIKIVHDDPSVACYYPSRKYINMPELKYLTSSEEATRTLLHEAIHATMQWQPRGLEYGDEEAVAELGSMFLASEFGIEIDMRNSLKYIWGWLGIPDGLFGYHKFIKIEDLKPEERAIIDKVTKLFDITKSAVDSLRKHVAQAESSTNFDLE